MGSNLHTATKILPCNSEHSAASGSLYMQELGDEGESSEYTLHEDRLREGQMRPGALFALGIRDPEQSYFRAHADNQPTTIL